MEKYIRNLSSKVTEGLIDDDQGGFKAGKGYVYQIFTLKKIGEKPQEKYRHIIRL